RIQIAVQTVDDNHARPAFDIGPNRRGKLPWRKLGWIDLPQADGAGGDCRLQVQADDLQPIHHQALKLIKHENGYAPTLSSGGKHILDGQGGLTGAGRADQQRTGPPLRTASEQSIQLGYTALQRTALERVGVLSCDEA